MRMLDLFAGLEGWSKPWRDRGHEVFSVDIEPSFDVDLHIDIMDLLPEDLPWQPDVILASPPCETFSLMTVGKNWTHDHQPKTEKAALHAELVKTTIALMRHLQPKAWVIENPRAKLRKMPFMQGVPLHTVWYCQYGMPYAKPTDLFGVVPFWFPRPECHNGAGDHFRAPRGSRTGIQGGMPTALRALVPYQLSEEIMFACERSAWETSS